MRNKKTAIDLTDLALGILVLGIVVTIGSTILVGMRDARLTELSTYTTANTTITGSNTTGTELANAYFKNIVSVTNTTGGETLGAGNYTTAVNTVNGKGTITIVGSQYDGQGLNVTYTSYNTSRADYALADDAAAGIGEYGNWFKIIVIVGVAAVILALIFMAFGRGASSVGDSGQGY